MGVIRTPIGAVPLLHATVFSRSHPIRAVLVRLWCVDLKPEGGRSLLDGGQGSHQSQAFGEEFHSSFVVLQPESSRMLCRRGTDPITPVPSIAIAAASAILLMAGSRPSFPRWLLQRIELRRGNFGVFDAYPQFSQGALCGVALDLRRRRDRRPNRVAWAGQLPCVLAVGACTASACRSPSTRRVSPPACASGPQAPLSRRG
jgi:hypothetical protein